ncbi:MAG6410 family transglutaminase-related lipoprotein [Mycoplasma tauri]|uniref:MAG6410 family transglutaminase-related lipoprotein n=1 Tax=Mycoplasma tauri TaxID=547987 RepID=UPI001CBBC4A2|nr:transglutaminase domain-containing protein [Mycoplasma tauri]MBZ4218522.1 hypothetical protein [Mycoplasma tauri]
MKNKKIRLAALSLLSSSSLITIISLSSSCLKSNNNNNDSANIQTKKNNYDNSDLKNIEGQHYRQKDKKKLDKIVSIEKKDESKLDEEPSEDNAELQESKAKASSSAKIESIPKPIIKNDIETNEKKTIPLEALIPAEDLNLGNDREEGMFNEKEHQYYYRPLIKLDKDLVIKKEPSESKKEAADNKENAAIHSKDGVDIIKQKILNTRYAGYNYYSHPDYHFNNDNVELKTDQSYQLQLFDKNNMPMSGVKWYLRTHYPSDFVYEPMQKTPDEVAITLSDTGLITSKKIEGQSKNYEIWAEYQGYIFKAEIKIYSVNETISLNHHELTLQKVKELTSNWKHLSNVQKALKAYEWITKNVKYVERGDFVSDQTAYSAIIEKASVCAGYAKGYKMFMDEMNIPSILLTGKVGNEWHLWNLVEIDSKWYHVDATWGAKVSQDGIQETYYNYFLISNYDIQWSRDYIKPFSLERMGTKYRAIKMDNFVIDKEGIKKLIERKLSDKTNNILELTTPFYNYDKEIQQAIKEITGANPQYGRKLENRHIRNFVKYEFMLPRIDKKATKVNLEVSKFTNDKSNYIIKIKTSADIELSSKNIFVEKAFIKDVEKVSDGYLVYLENFDTFGDANINLDIFKIGYDFIIKNKSFTFNVLKHETPNVVFEGVSDRSAILKNIDESMEYRVNTGEWKSVTKNEILLDDIGTTTVSIRKKETASHFASDIQLIKPYKPRDINNIVKYYGGWITGVNESMQYRLKGQEEWTNINDYKIKLPSGQYEIRVKPGINSLASEYHTVYVN